MQSLWVWSEGEYVSEELVRSVDNKRHQHITAGARTTAGFSVNCVCCIAAPLSLHSPILCAKRNWQHLLLS